MFVNTYVHAKYVLDGIPRYKKKKIKKNEKRNEMLYDHLHLLPTFLFCVISCLPFDCKIGLGCEESSDNTLSIQNNKIT